MAYRRAYAVRARVAAANYQHLLALGGNRRRGNLAGEEAVLSFKQLKREMDSFKFAPWNLEVARRRSSDCYDYGVVFLCEPFRGNVLSDFAVLSSLKQGMP